MQQMCLQKREVKEEKQRSVSPAKVSLKRRPLIAVKRSEPDNIYILKKNDIICSVFWFGLIISATCNVNTNFMWKMRTPLIQKPNGDAHRMCERFRTGVAHTV